MNGVLGGKVLVKHTLMSKLMMTPLVSCFALWITLLGSQVTTAREFFELEPILYSQSKPNNAVESLKLIEGFGSEVRSESEFLELLLEALNVPVSSQVLVYSKTSLQRGLISMRNPRAIYYNDTTYIGYVRGGDIEIAIHDENLGIAFYLIAPPRVVGQDIEIERPDSCLNCHVSRRTQDIPGVFIRSVSVNEETELLEPGSFDTTHKSPYGERWGGWYVTGNWNTNAHLGNTAEIRRRTNQAGELTELDFLTKNHFPLKTSDVVALAVLEHQCTIHNALIMARLRYQRAWYLYQSIEPEALQSDVTSSSWRVADSLAENIVNALLFVNEALIEGDGLSGDSAFIDAFEQASYRTESEQTLRKLRAVGRLFKYRCSYMIHSEAFESLPETVKQRVYTRLKAALTEPNHTASAHLGEREKAKILEILNQTLTW